MTTVAFSIARVRDVRANALHSSPGMVLTLLDSPARYGHDITILGDDANASKFERAIKAINEIFSEQKTVAAPRELAA